MEEADDQLVSSCPAGLLYEPASVDPVAPIQACEFSIILACECRKVNSSISKVRQENKEAWLGKWCFN